MPQHRSVEAALRLILKRFALGVLYISYLVFRKTKYGERIILKLAEWVDLSV